MSEPEMCEWCGKPKQECNELRYCHGSVVRNAQTEIFRIASELEIVRKQRDEYVAISSAQGTRAYDAESKLAAAVAERDELQRQLAKAMVLIRRYSERRAGAANIGMELNRMAGVLLAEYDAARASAGKGESR